MDTSTRLPRAAIAALVITTFLIVNAIGLVPFRAVATDLTGWPRIAALAVVGYGLYLVGPLAVAALLVGPRRAFAALGLTASPWPALLFAFGCTAVIGVYALATAPLADNIAMNVMRGAVLPGAAEEILFRAFLFGVLYRFAGWGFLPAALLSSCVFGIEHVYQGGDAMEALGIAVLTGIGGLWWSWLLVEWRWNAWVPIAFHVLMNAWFEMFTMADNAMGDAAFIGVRLGCIVLSVVVTLVIARRRGGPELSGRRWWRG